MSTRIAVLCDRLLEAGWLAALIVAPLFFNVYSSRVFEPDKITLVRSIALVMVAAWIVRQIERGRPHLSLADWWRSVRQDNPLIVPTAALVISYIISTVFSLVPAISLWGSYQRLEGTYSTFSYIVIFLVAVSTLRTRAQLNRAISTAIVVSFPISFYGLLQHYSLDPLPWGGPVTERVASNMGNAIFVAAYLIMVVPLTAARWIETLTQVTKSTSTRSRLLVVAVAAIALLALAALMVFDFVLGSALLVAVFILGALLIVFLRLPWREGLLATAYTVVLATQLVAIFFTQSRGPWLGLGGGLFVFAMLYALARGARQVVLGSIGLAVLAAAFLISFNIPNSPLAPLKQVPYIGRLGEILDTESGTAQVRELIWQGAVQLILPHQPLWSPTTGNDPFNIIRPLVGYGPEAMYVAFNPFYPPDLAHLESRNASPDRSHNETFDSLVTTGLIGFIAYVLLFTSIFYFGIKWLGLITSRGERNAFIALWLAGGFFSAVVFGLWRGWYYVGVALPAGMILGLFVFLIVDVLRHFHADVSHLDPRRSLWISALIAAMIGHFIEIHFGIAIVSTRTYFWFYAALLVILGTQRLAETAPAPAPAPTRAPESTPTPISERERRRRRRRAENVRTAARKENGQPTEVPLAPVLVSTLITSMVVMTLAYEFVNNQSGVSSALEAVRRSLFFKGNAVSIGVFLMLAFSWAIAGLVTLGEEFGTLRVTRNGMGLAVALFSVVSLTVFVWYIVFQMRWLTQPGDLTDGFISVLGLYYIALFLLLAALAIALALDALPLSVVLLRAPVNAALAPVLTVAVIGAIYLTNFTGISADILYKSGGNFDNSGAWDKSIAVYQRALTLQPTQDFYALFLGRAYLEGARASSDSVQRAQMLGQAQQILLEAQHLNPLNTDHTANLARLQRIWATLVSDPAQRAEHYAKSSEYYQDATRLSPNTAYLYNEWSQTYFLSGDLDKTRAELEQSLKIDSQFAQTYLYLGEYYRAKKDTEQATENYLKAIAIDPAALSQPDNTPLPEPMQVLAQPANAPRALAAYQAVLAKDPASLPAHYALAELYKRTGQPDKARQELEAAIQATPNDVMARLALVNFYSEAGQIDNAVSAMRAVMEFATPSSPDYARFQDFDAQLQNLQKAIQAAQKSPNDVAAHRTVAAMWKARGQPQFALPEYQIVAQLAPNDYDANKNLALLNLQLDHADQAANALEKAAALAPDNEKGLWQNLMMALNSQKSQQWDQALQEAQAALALAGDADRTSVQAFITQLQNQIASAK